MSARLPYELIGTTLAFCDIAELQTTACAARALQLQAEPHLYRHALLARPGSAVHFAANLARCRERARYVRGLIVADAGVARQALSALLALLENLQILQLRICADGIAAQAYTFTLKELSIYADGDALQPADFVQFLNDCGGQALKLLELPLSADLARHAALSAHVAANPGSLANVTTLRASYDVILAFVRNGAALEHIYAPSLDVVPDEFFQAVEQGTCDLNTLHGIRTLDAYDLLKTLGKVCPRLDSAELMIDQSRGLSTFAVNLAKHQAEKAPAVHAELRCLLVRLIAPDGTLNCISESTMKDMMGGLALCCPKLIQLNGYAFV